jgi:succinyl-CoA synthetase beta subunit/citryl-CoA synthetase large subunit
VTRLLEHHGLALLESAGVRVAPYRAVETPAGAIEAALALGGRVVVKALVPAGGRGKAGAVRTAATPEAAGEAARDLLGGRVGHFPVEQLLVQARVDVREEHFCALTFDSMTRGPVVLFSAIGGVDVEDLVRDHPERLVTRAVEPGPELAPFVAREIAEAGGLSGQRLLDVADVLTRLYRVFRTADAFLVEVNPLAVDADGAMVAPSAVVTVDDQADFRHPEWDPWVEAARSNGWRPLTPLERQMRGIDATDAGSAIRFNELGGLGESGEPFERAAPGTPGRRDIACMITGGGSGLVALDHFSRLGEEPPATTFDITPGRIEEKMYLAARAILSRPGLRGLVAGGNISNFIPVDLRVRGVVRALKELGVDGSRFPVVLRYAGPGVETARGLAAEVPGVEFHDERTSLEEAVERIVARVRGTAA